jgi:hypothetical protein
MSKPIKKISTLLAILPLLAFLSSNAWGAGASFTNASVGNLFAGDTRACVFFTLTGVNEADPALPGVAWFVVPKTHPFYRETYALLLSAKLSGRPVNVVTTGVIDPCGHAQVLVVAMP